MNNSCKKCVFIQTAELPNPPTLRNIEIFHYLGYKVEFWGAKRGSASKVLSNPLFEWKRIGIQYPLSSWMYLVGTPVFILIANIKLCVSRPKVVHASDLEGALSCFLYKILSKGALILVNIHDNFALRYRLGYFAKYLLSRIEGMSMLVGDLLIVPDESRLKMLKPCPIDNIIIVPNTPWDCGKRDSVVSSRNRLRVVMSGWMVWTRGFKQIGDIVKQRDDIDLIILSAGGADDVLKYARNLPNTKFMCDLPQAEVLEILKDSDLLIALYDPAIEINRHAAPNKVYDALAASCPILINSECSISQNIVEWECGYTVSYGDSRAIGLIFDDLLKNRWKILEMGTNGRNVYEQRFSWQMEREKIILKINQLTSS